MKFLLDENFAEAVAPTLAGLFLGHEFISAFSKPHRYCNVDDVVLFPMAKDDGFDAIITHDHEQIRRYSERLTLLQSDLHWIGLKPTDKPGIAGLAFRSAGVIAALPFMLEERPAQPHIYRLKGVTEQRSQRLRIEPVLNSFIA